MAAGTAAQSGMAAAGLDAHLGRCRRFPAEVQKHDNDWCCEFLPRETEDTKQ